MPIDTLKKVFSNTIEYLSNVASGGAKNDIHDVLLSLNNFDEYKNNSLNNSKNSLKINCYIVDKSLMNKEGTLHFPYGPVVKNITISTSTAFFGYNASVVIEDIEDIFLSILNKTDEFYFVIAIFEELGIIEDDKKEKKLKGIMYQPYIFDIDNFQILSEDKAKNKIFKINLSDFISGTLKKTSYGNLLLNNPNFLQATNIPSAIGVILRHAAGTIMTNHNNNVSVNVATYHQTELIPDSYPELLRAKFFDEFKLDTSLYNVLITLTKNAAIETKEEAEFGAIAEIPDNVLLPAIYSNEYFDIGDAYRKYFTNGVYPEKIVEPFSNDVIGNGMYWKRFISLRTMKQPFELCFKNKQVFETINRAENNDETLKPFGNISDGDNIYDAIEVPVDSELVNLRWRNLALFADNPHGACSMIIFFQWLYEYFKHNFLFSSHAKKNLKKSFEPPVKQHFYKLQKDNKVNGNLENFTKLNSSSIICKSQTPLKEAMFHAGSTLKSFVLLNNIYSFKIRGAMQRRVNEIIKINSTTKSGEVNENLLPELNKLEGSAHGYTLLYVTRIDHHFNGANFEDTIYCNKICYME